MPIPTDEVLVRLEGEVLALKGECKVLEVILVVVARILLRVAVGSGAVEASDCEHLSRESLVIGSGNGQKAGASVENRILRLTVLDRVSAISQSIKLERPPGVLVFDQVQSGRVAYDDPIWNST